MQTLYIVVKIKINHNIWDIDSDFRCDIKDVLLVYLKLKYGERAVAQILTKSYLQGRSALLTASRILSSRDTLERKARFDRGEKMAAHETVTDAKGKTSIVPVDYDYIVNKIKKAPGVDLDNNSMADNKAAMLRAATAPIEKELVEAAVLLDNNLDHTGLHAAGCIISDNSDLSEYIPVAWDIGAQTWKTQCNMVQCEELHGLLKMDLLLLTTLDIITYTLRLVKQNYPNVEIDIENLPIEEKVIQGIYATGDTKAIFQFESPGMMKVLKQMNPTSIEDIIAANAMYRPGPMDEIPNYIRAKNSGDIHYDCPQLEPILGTTYGTIVYQEQVMRIVRDLAGYSMGRSDLVRRAMSKKKFEVLSAERKNFVYGNKEEGIHGCVALGISEDAANAIFDKMISFAAYAFNKSHAAAYSVTSYMTAWLKYYYPAEFLTAAMNFTNKIDDLPSLIADAKKHGIEVLPPHINKSQAMFSTEYRNGKPAIRFGLAFLRGCKGKAQDIIDAREGQFSSFKAFVATKPGKAMAEACIKSGAFDGNAGTAKRSALWEAYLILEKMIKKIDSAQDKYNTLASTENVPQEKLDEAAANLKAAQEAFANEPLPQVEPWTSLKCIQDELQYTSTYFSGDPMDQYVTGNWLTDIDKLTEDNNIWIAGVLTDVETRKTRSSAQMMMSGTITDRTGSIPFAIYPQAYERVNGSVGLVTALKGRMVAKDGEDPKFIVSDVKELPLKAKARIVVNNPSKEEVALIRANHVSKGGMPVCVKTYGAMNETNIHVTQEVMDTLGIKYRILSND